jgi:uncharacterized BrkB/YihY/UPF0761 family membrane protein
MFFLYIQALIFLYGAEVNRSLADFRGDSMCRKKLSREFPLRRRPVETWLPPHSSASRRS